MVVQRELPVHVWGMAAPGEQVSVTFRGETRSAVATRVGRWSVYLKPGTAGGPFEVKVAGVPVASAGQAARVKVPLQSHLRYMTSWLETSGWRRGSRTCSIPLERANSAAADLPKADNARLRLLIVNKKTADFPQDDIDTAGWAASGPETAKAFSAVAWYLAREIEQREHVPVGVIDSTWGGARPRLGRG